MITKLTIDFLKDLKKNNTKEWFQENKKRYELSHKEVYTFADAIIEKLNQHDVIETPSGKKSMFRIYRDVRFSKNKEPYKTNRSGSFSRYGSDRRGGYYFSIEPGNSMIGGGFYAPNKEDLQLIRDQISLDAAPLRSVLENKTFKSYFGSLQGEQLKTAPRGFEKDDPNIDLLRFKNFYVMHRFTDEEVMSENFIEQAMDGFLKILPFFDVMTEYLTTDLNGESVL
ncbi:MAG: DUF2461 domain-containing protein [Bacteroidetes bacterium]|nr:MAG: DUF2461 domain-containing protein [Bacteroidota bacterium]MBL1145669.1 DUF2461 domain-containing protein [Bacteroidota bacterium]NOG58463.1 DUF2461 domain-containing protein [Bacteroidota bacterium]